MERLILASGSPRRRELLQQLGVSFEVVTADIAELDSATAPGLAPLQLARENALRKAQAVESLRPDQVILGADTVVALGPRVMGKPGSLDEAREFLRALSGQTHEVITACAIVDCGGEEVFHDISRVTFRPLSDEIIARYLAAVHVLDKAGAYALQEHGDWVIARVEGSETNVIGLPTEMLSEILHRRGFNLQKASVILSGGASA